MSKNRTFARPYAKAAFQQAQKENAFSKWSEMLSLAAEIAQDKIFVKLVKLPDYTRDQLVTLFLEIGKDNFSEEMKNFIRTLAQYKRLTVLAEIKELYEEMRAQVERVVNVELISAFPVTKEYQDRLSKALARKTNCNVKLHCQTDSRILGGAIVKSGDLIIDGSVKGRLATLSDALNIS